jgi:hypothetical protein
MLTVLDNIESNFNMDEAMEDDFNDFESLLNMAKTMNQNNLYKGGLSETEVYTLEEIVSDGQPLTSPFALSLLKRNNPQYVYSEPVYDVSQSFARMARPSDDKSFDSEEQAEFKLYPNPAHDYTTIELSENWTNSAELIIYNAVGQKVTQRNYDKGETNLKVNLQSLKPGLYYFNLINNGESIGIDKLIILE